ncbi:uncharacterized protein LOC117559868 [Gymnodraco acuticeps]|uniref:Uncharacterized protein LOC117559868 n=1 Tax=Gymnodraco acuticeps TaxID=8218 RepID=A0A6P8WXW0_GYMAC|nr:uncharacterized protein LOC117559868 [Gymnodraco acuticeps]
MMIKIEAQSLAEEVGSYRFSIYTVVWYDILSKVKQVSKVMQSVSMQLDIAVDLLRKTKATLEDYRATGFASAQIRAKDMCENMDVDAVLKEKRLRSTKRQFSYEAPDEPMANALKKMEVTFFNRVVDVCITSLNERFEHLEEVQAKFGVLVNFPELPRNELTKQCQTLSNTLSSGGQSDIDGKELALELMNFPTLPSPTMTTLELLVFLERKNLREVYPNMWVALRIAVTMPVTVASAERSFSKLKLIKTYLRSTMVQERLSGLAIISINSDVSRQLSYEDVIDDFAAKKSRRVQF